MLVRVSNAKGDPIYQYDEATKSSVFLNGTLFKGQCENGIEYYSRIKKAHVSFSTKDKNFHDLFLRYVKERHPDFKISMA